MPCIVTALLTLAACAALYIIAGTAREYRRARRQIAAVRHLSESAPIALPPHWPRPADPPDRAPHWATYLVRTRAAQRLCRHFGEDIQ